eukprot:CAMPEP_0169187066 /NCGR_PEP_ID=MMETSP1016-20121227/2716_1 /TAXON_ID=342587 /ORGANISM="Karlodinium micrum, Strain CCMP2283" /LENGTH=499 /DNA_ID=CAMNT_0009262981 /DNA_START=149 /DNA_END=1649 /DNA_ORIENTATION=+
MPNYGDDVEVQPRPVVIYLHANASCRLEALPLVPQFLPLGISLFTLDFAGCGESDGEYISLGWYERDDLAVCVDYLREHCNVSAIGLWGRGLGDSFNAAHRDHSIAGVVLDSPFCSLRELALELAQSDNLPVKIPSWLGSTILAMLRMRIRSLCGFDIDDVNCETHVSSAFIPAFFVSARKDEFIGVHHTQKLYEAYTGDKEINLVDGDHNSARSPEDNAKAVRFLCRAFRCEVAPPQPSSTLARILGFDAVSIDGSTEFSLGSQQLREDACRLLATAGGGRVWLGERQHIFMPFRIESALQLNERQTEAGFCVCLFPLPTEWGGVNRPPHVFFAFATVGGLKVTRATEAQPEVLAEIQCDVQMAVPFLCALEVRPRAPHIRLSMGIGADVFASLDDEYSHDCHVWPMTKLGEATFFDCALTDLQPIGEDEDLDDENAPQTGSTEVDAEFLFPEAEVNHREGNGYRGSRRGPAAVETGAIPNPVPEAQPQRSSGMCQQQ